jgi:hypothetical protein
MHLHAHTSEQSGSLYLVCKTMYHVFRLQAALDHSQFVHSVVWEVVLDTDSKAGAALLQRWAVFEPSKKSLFASREAYAGRHAPMMKALQIHSVMGCSAPR